MNDIDLNYYVEKQKLCIMNFANYCKYIVHSFKEILCLRIIDYLFFYLRSSILWGLLFTTLIVFIILFSTNGNLFLVFSKLVLVYFISNFDFVLSYFIISVLCNE